MKIDISIKYQAIVFANVKHITPNTENISTLLEAFRDKGLIPSIFQEIGSANTGISPRIMLNSINMEWIILFASDRISVEKNPLNIEGSNMGSVEDFCTDVSNIYSRIFEKFRTKSNRLALVTTYLFEEMSPKALEDTYKKFIKPNKFYSKNIPFEWNCKSAAKMPFIFAGFDEQINAITSLNRVKLELNVPDSVIPIDRIQLAIDLNTIPEKTDTRFDIDHIKEFFKLVLTDHGILLKEMGGIMNE